MLQYLNESQLGMVAATLSGMSRYTGKSLEVDVERLNIKLAETNSTYRFVVGYRYNYTAIDLATPEQVKAHCCQRNLETGTPRQCLAACHAYMVNS